MRVARRDARPAQAQPLLGRLARQRQQIGQLVPAQMPALEQHGLGAQAQQVGAGGFEVSDFAHGPAQQQRGLVKVRRDQAGAREQLGHQRGDGLLPDQRVAAGRHHHRVQHHALEPVMVDRPGHHLDDLGRMQHADLDRVDADVLDNGGDLRLQEVRRHAVDRAHADRVLRRQRGDRAHAVAAQRGKGLEVGLDARAAAGIAAGNGQDAWVMGVEFLAHRKIIPQRPRAARSLLQESHHHE